jgi:hypothetical protein
MPDVFAYQEGLVVNSAEPLPVEVLALQGGPVTLTMVRPAVAVLAPYARRRRLGLAASLASAPRRALGRRIRHAKRVMTREDVGQRRPPPGLQRPDSAISRARLLATASHHRLVAALSNPAVNGVQVLLVVPPGPTRARRLGLRGRAVDALELLQLALPAV